MHIGFSRSFRFLTLFTMVGVLESSAMSANASQVPLAAILSLTGNYGQVGIMQERALQMAVNLSKSARRYRPVSA